MNTRYRLGVDIGGTFTDAMLWDEHGGASRVAKVSSTPDDPSVGFLRVARQILEDANAAPSQVALVVHGTTVVTNAVIEGKTGTTAFVTTRGFRDLLEIARQTRPLLYDLQFEKTPPLVPRDLCFEVPERIDAHGGVIELLDEDAVRRIGMELAARGVIAVAVRFLHAYVNPAHERRAGELLREALPGVSVSLSSDVAPESGEYVRGSTTVVNAAVRPVAQRSLRAIERDLAADGFSCPLLVMQSNGGVMTAESAGERPVFMVESGPAAGVMAAAHLAEQLEIRNALAFDMGGTTAKASLVRDGRPTVTKDFEVGAKAAAGVGVGRGSGYPIRAPVIDLVEIGAGGGSIAWVDSGGVLRVGPQSAGADPGPAGYGRGGTLPTITDANLVLGRLNPEFFLGGELRLDVGAARRAIEEHCARPLGLDAVAAAHGIVEIAKAAMTNALHLISVQRGHDPRDFALVAFGGAGPLHANALAAELQIPTTVIPISPGITSAMGLLATDLTHEFSRTLRRRFAALDGVAVEEAFRGMEAEGRRLLRREGVADSDTGFRRFLEMRYVGQGYELTVPLEDDQLGPEALERALTAFHDEHRRAYGHSAPQEPVEVVNVRLVALGRITRPRLREAGHIGRGTGGVGVADAPKATRPVYFAEGGYVDCPIYDRDRLRDGDVVDGPAIVEQLGSTTAIYPDYCAAVDRFGNLHIRRGGAHR